MANLNLCNYMHFGTHIMYVIACRSSTLKIKMRSLVFINSVLKSSEVMLFKSTIL